MFIPSCFAIFPEFQGILSLPTRYPKEFCVNSGNLQVSTNRKRGTTLFCPPKKFSKIKSFWFSAAKNIYTHHNNMYR
jgi:hypothetical protein